MAYIVYLIRRDDLYLAPSPGPRITQGVAEWTPRRDRAKEFAFCVEAHELAETLGGTVQAKMIFH